MRLPLRPEVEAAFATSLELPDVEQSAFLRREYPVDPALWMASKIWVTLNGPVPGMGKSKGVVFELPEFY